MNASPIDYHEDEEQALANETPNISSHGDNDEGEGGEDELEEEDEEFD